MANHAMNRMPGMPRLSGRSQMIRLLVAALAVALVLLAANQLRRDALPIEQVREAGLGVPVSAPSQSFSTEQYWEMARELPPITSQGLVAEQPAYFTEQYWKMAEALPMTSAPAVEQPAYFTEQYWRLAAELDAKAAAPAVEQPAYFTEQYWKLAEETKVNPAPAPEWSYYTERYWSLSQ
jgi:hypothetical protein